MCQTATGTGNTWTGQPMLGDYIALAAGAAETGHGGFAAASTGLDCVTIRADQIGEFLCVHARRRLVCFDAGSLHWALHEILCRSEDDEARRVLWDFSGDGRLYDIRLLDRLVRLAEDGACHPARSLKELSAQVAPRSLEASEAGSPSSFEGQVGSISTSDSVLDYDGRAADGILVVFHQLLLKAENVINEFGIDHETLTRFGPLGLALGVQAAIALGPTTQTGLNVNKEARRNLLDACYAWRSERIIRMRRDRIAKHFFKLDGDSVRIDGQGYPELITTLVRKWLESVVLSLTTLFRLPVPIPRVGGLTSTDPNDWDILASFHPLLKDWYELMTVCSLAKTLTNQTPSILNPEYEVFPRLSSHRPGLDALRRLRLPFLHPASGHLFCVVSFYDLELRALATILERKYGPSHLAQLFQTNKEVATETARRLSGLDEEAFVGLLERDEQMFARWLGLARVFLKLVPIGAGPEAIKLMAARDFGVPLTHAEVAGYYRRFVEEIFPEMGPYTRDDTIDRMSSNLGVPPGDLLQDLRLCIDPNPDSGRLTAAFFEDLAGGYSVPEVMEVLLSLRFQKPGLDRRELTPALYHELTGCASVTLTGQVRGKASRWEALTLCPLDLADAVVKSSAYTLVAAGFRLAAVTKGELVLEIPESSRNSASLTVAQGVRSAGKSILGEVPVHFDIQWKEFW